MHFQSTSWPDSLPAEENHYFFSVNSGTKKLRLAFHHPIEQGGMPIMSWSTKHLDREELKSSNKLKILAEILPTSPLDDLNGASLHEFLFGSNDLLSLLEHQEMENNDEGRRKSVSYAIRGQKIKNIQKRARERAKEMTVYIVTSNGNQTQHIAQLFGSSLHISRIYEMSNKDFFTSQEQLKGFMDTSVLASLRGARTLHKYRPCLVLDVDDVIRCAGVDQRGSIVPGFAMMSGLKAKLESFQNAQPTAVTIDDIVKRCEAINLANEQVGGVQKKGRKAEDEQLKAFSTRSNEDSIMYSTFMDLIKTTYGIIAEWAEKVGGYNPESRCHIFIIKSEDSDMDQQNRLTAAQIFYKLITEDDHGGWIHTSCFSDGNNDKQRYKISEHWKVRQRENLLHHGVTYAVMRQYQLARHGPKHGSSPMSKEDERLIGKRVTYEKTEGRFSYGEVMKCNGDRKDTYNILFDHGVEIVPRSHVEVMISDYQKIGRQKSSPKKTAEKKIRQEKRKRDSSEQQKRKKQSENDIRKYNQSVRKRDEEDKSLVGQMIAKDFDGEVYFGKITGVQKGNGNRTMFCIHYTDGDREDLYRGEVKKAMELYAKEAKKVKMDRQR